MKKQTQWMKRILTGSVLLVSLSGCLSVADMMGYDSQTMNDNAAKNYMNIVNQAHSEGVLDTSSVTAKRVKNVFNQLVPYATQENKTGLDFNWQLNVIRSNELNAFAMPGGKMVVYTGIVEQLKLTDAEIAAIMGHEMTHALLEHSKAAAGQQVLTNMAMQVGSSVMAAKTNMSEQGIDATTEILGKYGLNLPFSRYQESQADAGGLHLMARAGYDPHAAISLWQKMSDYNGSNIPAILSTHPSNQARLQAMTKLLPQVMPIYEQSLASQPRKQALPPRVKQKK
ncbi:M48 family metallopeptidase [Neisseriaceae bacterium ESL0693]|nr:M48 family metallopeptidase [Neisseriaceae bacterium ESL0693]